MTHVFLLQSHLLAARGALRDDGRARVAALIGLLFFGGTALMGTLNLSLLVAEWRAAGDAIVAVRLWMLCGVAWAILGFLTLLATFRQALSDQEAMLWLPLPLPPALRFRLLMQSVWSLQLVQWLAPVGLALALALRDVRWLLLLLSGAALASLLSVAGTLLAVRYLLPHPRRVLAGAVALILLAALALRGERLSMDALPSPLGGAALLSGLSLLALGPLAGPLGHLQAAAYLTLQGRGGTRAAGRVPGLGPALAWLTGRRSPAAALLTRDILSRSRSPFTWLRLALLPLYILLLFWLRAHVAPPQAQPLWLALVGSLALLFLLLMDSSPSPIGGEGERLRLLLVCPLRLEEWLGAKGWAFFWPALATAALLALLFAAVLRLTTGEGAALSALLLLCVGGMSAIFVLGSAWDADADAAAEGEMQSFLLEEAPITPVRLLLLNGGALFVAGALAATWWLPLPLSLLALALADALLWALLWPLALRRLRAVVR